ncbi:MAG TPA: hypothetical protein VFU07_08895 [Candidatus Lumbricidophila sp.]|nr:hypothetical protein [Candidatus Lumbricidophila sp.]
MSLLASVLTNEEAAAAAGTIPPPALGAIALVVFLVLLGVTWSYRDVANRHRAKAEAYAAQHQGDAAHH